MILVKVRALPQPPNHLTSFRLLCIEVVGMGEGWEDGKMDVDIGTM
jgi:hypothetical protein